MAQQVNTMGKSNTCDIQQDERLAEVVKKYGCLYDKAHAEYKNKDTRNHAWQAVDLELGYELGTSVKQFETLKKRYSRKRQTLRKSTIPSGVDTSKEINKAQKDLEEYLFLSWMNEHTRSYTCKPNNFETTDEDKCIIVFTNDSCNRNEDEGYERSEIERTDTDDDDDDDDDSVLANADVYNTTYIQSSNPSSKIEPPPKKKVKISEEDIINNTEKINKKKKHNFAEKKFDIMKNTSKVTNTRQILESNNNKNNDASSSNTVTDQDELFGKMIAGELRTFPAHIKYRVKHELNKVIFSFKAQEMEHSI